MMTTPSSFFCCLSIAISITIMTSTPSLFMSWLILEMNTLTFIPLILFFNKKTSGEMALKYFLSQTLASIFLVFAVLCPFLMNSNLIEFMILSALALKMGAAPFHAWLPAMVNLISWETLFILLTVQKINPLIIITQFSCSTFLMFLAVFSVTTGSLMGLMQTQIRKILSYSSINQVGWLILASSVSMIITWSFLALYLFLMIPIILMSNVFNMNTLQQLSLKPNSFMFSFLFYLNLLSLGGLPPFLGFLPKWILLNSLVMQSAFFLTLMLVFTSLLTLFFYLRLTFYSLLMSANQWNTEYVKLNFKLILLTFLNIFCLSFSFLI